MYRRPASDRNYEFWGDQTFFGENPPQAAVVTWLQKQQAGEVKLRITDSAGREVREISGQVLANSNKAGIQAACWDLRVQPAPAPVTAGRGGRGGGQAAQVVVPGGRGAQAPSPFGAGCGGGGGRGGGGFFFGGGGNPGPFVLAGTYNVSLIVDGKTVDTRPLRVLEDPQVALTAVERKRLFDMAMEMHELQRRSTEVANQINAVNAGLPELAKELSGRNDVPDDVKAAFEAFRKEWTAFAPKFASPAGFGRGGGGGGRGGAASLSVLARIAQAKNGMMGGMWPGDAVMRAYNEAKTETPKAIADANALFAKAAAQSAALEKYKLTLKAPEPVK